MTIYSLDVLLFLFGTSLLFHVELELDSSFMYFSLYAEYVMRNAGLEETQAGIKVAGRNINNLRYADDTTLMEKWRTKEPLDESERGEWKSWLKAQHSEN